MNADEAKKIFLRHGNDLPDEVQEAVKFVLDNFSGIEQLAKSESEIWRDVVGYEGLYRVSNLGRVKSLHFKVEKIMKLTETGYNQKYLKATLSRDGASRPVLVHILVAKAFIPNPENFPVINHKDGNPKNNCVENLEWTTQKENILHAYKIGLRKSEKGTKANGAKFNAEQVRYIRTVYKPHDKKFGLKALAKKFHVAKETIHRVVRYKSYEDVE